jgi:F0F1-type ATP synthase membrane subunit b/b'
MDYTEIWQQLGIPTAVIISLFFFVTKVLWPWMTNFIEARQMYAETAIREAQQLLAGSVMEFIRSQQVANRDITEVLARLLSVSQQLQADSACILENQATMLKNQQEIKGEVIIITDELLTPVPVSKKTDARKR